MFIQKALRLPQRFSLTHQVRYAGSTDAMMNSTGSEAARENSKVSSGWGERDHAHCYGDFFLLKGHQQFGAIALETNTVFLRQIDK